MLAGIGAARLRDRWGARRGWTAVAVGILAVVNAEALRAPLDYVPFDGIPRIYDTLNAVPPGAVLELPIYGPTAIFRNAPYLVNSTRHWRPLVNGYSGFTPPGYRDIYRRMRHFPHPWAIDWLREHHVTQVVLHASAFEALKGRAQLEKVEMSPDIALETADGDIRVYRVLPAR